MPADDEPGRETAPAQSHDEPAAAEPQATANYFDGYHEHACRVRSRRREEAEGPRETLSASLPRRLQYSSARFTIKMIFARRAAGHPTTAWRAMRRVRRNFYSPRRPKSAKSSGGKNRSEERRV